MPMAPKTLQNLKSAFHAETGVYFKYTLWADRARKAGHHAVGTLFDQVARNEWAHAKIWYKRLNQEMDTQEALLARAANTTNGARCTRNGPMRRATRAN